jgi:hypothetical protein
MLPGTDREGERVAADEYVEMTGTLDDVGILVGVTAAVTVEGRS